MATNELDLPYACAACSKTFTATVSDLPDPEALVSQRSREVLRRTHEARRELSARIGQPGPTGDPVEDVNEHVVRNAALEELKYATCPGCGAQNPDGLANDRTENRVATWGTIGLMLVVGAVAYFAPAVAYVVPIVSLLLLLLRLAEARKATGPVHWRIIVLQAVLGIGLGVPIYLWPRWAFVVPLVVAASVLPNALRRPRASARFERARARIRFHGHAYR